MRADRIRAALDEDLIVLVAGFQGVSTAKDVTTLGRGGSDTTAVALAAAMGAEVCEIYTDVAGVFSADPRIVPDARKLPVVSFEEMLEMSASGAGVLQLRSVEYARNHGVRIHCRSSFTEEPGTFVVGEEETMERPLITAVTHSRDEARVTLLGVPDHPGIAGRIFTALADANVNVDMIIQNEPVSEGAAGRHVVHRPAHRPAHGARRARPGRRRASASRAVAEDPAMGKVSVVGAGMKSHPGVAAKVFSTLGDEGINIEMISTSPIKISCVVRGRRGRPRRARAARGVRARRRPGRGRAPLRSTERAMSVPRRRRGRHRRRRHRHAAPSCASATSPRARSSRSPPSARPGASSTAAIVQPLTDETIQGFDLAIFSAGGATSGEWAPRFVDAGAVVVDNSSAWRRDPEVPLVVAEVNPEALDGHKGLIANPNCSTMQLMVALKPIHDAAGHRAADRLHLPVGVRHRPEGGRGARGPDARGAARHASRRRPQVYPHPIAFNVLGGAGNFADGDDHTDEERKMMFETRKILGDESIAIKVTCARVPVTQLALGVRHAADARAARGRARRARCSRRMPGLAVVDDPAPHAYPTARGAAGRDEVFVGRLRRDPSHERGAEACGSSRTTCSRAPRPTRSRSPSCCTSAGSCAARAAQRAT